MRQLVGNAGIGHVRYPTAGCDGADEAQPFYVNAPFGIGLGHNGNLTNAEELSRTMVEEDRRHLNTRSDSEVLLNVFASELQRSTASRPAPADVFRAIEGVFRRCRGGYAVVLMIVGHGIAGFRDPHGIRPLVLGKRKTARGIEWMLASESVALDMLGFALERDVGAGGGDLRRHARAACIPQQCAPAGRHTPCIFEYVYFARPDSIIDNISVHKARMRMGEKLAEKIQRLRPEHDIDVVIPIPDTSRTSALQLALALGVKYREGFVKNRYIGRTFIMPGQEMRQKSVRGKLNAIDLEFRGRNVLLVDDSIVRGTTSAQIIELAREAGARKVYFASAAPPVRFPNVYGIDMAVAAELVANGRSEEDVAAFDRRGLADLPGPRRPGLRLPARQCAHHGLRHLLLLGRIRDWRRHRRVPRAHRARPLGRRARPAHARTAGRPHRPSHLTRPMSGPAADPRRNCSSTGSECGARRGRRAPARARGACDDADARTGPSACSRSARRRLRWRRVRRTRLASGSSARSDRRARRRHAACRSLHCPDSTVARPDILRRTNAASPRARPRSLSRQRRRPGSRVLLCVSGGASALIEAPAPGVTLAELRARSHADSESRARHRSAEHAARRGCPGSRAGRLAGLFAGATVEGLMISDVPRDDPAVAGLRPPRRPAVHAWSARLDDALEAVLALPRQCAASSTFAQRTEARGRCGRRRRAISATNSRSAPPTCRSGAARPWCGCRISAGRGGRCQHLALAAANHIAGHADFLVLAAGTDGRDGASEDAGAIVDGGTIERALGARLRFPPHLPPRTAAACSRRPAT